LSRRRSLRQGLNPNDQIPLPRAGFNARRIRRRVIRGPAEVCQEGQAFRAEK